MPAKRDGKSSNKTTTSSPNDAKKKASSPKVKSESGSILRFLHPKQQNNDENRRNHSMTAAKAEAAKPPAAVPPPPPNLKPEIISILSDNDEDEANTDTTTTASAIKNNETVNHTHAPEDAPPSSSSSSSSLLGLKRVKDPMASTVSLHENCILGRNPQPLKSSKKEDTNRKPRIDLGLTKDNAKQVSRQACIIESITNDQLTLVIPSKIFHNPQIYPLQFRRHDSMMEETLDTERLVLHPGDHLIFFSKPKCHHFEVVVIINTVPPGTKIHEHESRRTSTTRSQVPNASTPIKSTTTTATSTSSSQITSKSKRTITEQMSTSPRKKICTAAVGSGRTFLEKGETQFDLPWPRTWTTIHDTKNEEQSAALPIPPKQVKEQLIKEHNSWSAPNTLARTKLSSKDDCDDYYDSGYDSEDDDYDDGDTAPFFLRIQDMHVSHTNTYGKALHSTTPTVGIHLLHLLLDNHRLPTLKLCRQLVQLVTFGCYHSGKNNGTCCLDEAYSTTTTTTTTTTRNKEPTPIWDGTRVSLCHRYIKTVLQKYPQLAYDRFAEAAGTDYWKNALEQLYTLPYINKNKETTSTTTTTTTIPMLEESLQLHVSAMQLFHRLLNGLIHRRGTNSPLIRDMDIYGGSAVCKVAASVMAHVWVNYGHYYLFQDDNNDDIHSSNLMPIIDDLTRYLGTILQLLLQKFVAVDSTTKRNGNIKQAIDILWNAMDQKIQNSDHVMKDKDWRMLQIKLHWIESLDWPELEEGLAKRLRMTKEYNGILPGGN